MLDRTVCGGERGQAAADETPLNRDPCLNRRQAATDEHTAEGSQGCREPQGEIGQVATDKYMAEFVCLLLLIFLSCAISFVCSTVSVYNK